MYSPEVTNHIMRSGAKNARKIMAKGLANTQGLTLEEFRAMPEGVQVLLLNEGFFTQESITSQNADVSKAAGENITEEQIAELSPDTLDKIHGAGKVALAKRNMLCSVLLDFVPNAVLDNPAYDIGQHSAQDVLLMPDNVILAFAKKKMHLKEIIGDTRSKDILAEALSHASPSDVSQIDIGEQTEEFQLVYAKAGFYGKELVRSPCPDVSWAAFRHASFEKSDLNVQDVMKMGTKIREVMAKVFPNELLWDQNWMVSKAAATNIDFKEDEMPSGWENDLHGAAVVILAERGFSPDVLSRHREPHVVTKAVCYPGFDTSTLTSERISALPCSAQIELASRGVSPRIFLLSPDCRVCEGALRASGRNGATILKGISYDEFSKASVSARLAAAHHGIMLDRFALDRDIEVGSASLDHPDFALEDLDQDLLAAYLETDPEYLSERGFSLREVSECLQSYRDSQTSFEPHP